jgi:hypothetical protein
LYTILIDEQAKPQVDALPAVALVPFAELRAMLETAPWGGRPYRSDKPDGSLRVQPFGIYGQTVYLILEDQRRVDILVVQWAG